MQMALMVHKMMTANDKKDGLHRMVVAGFVVAVVVICWYLVRELHKRPAHARRRALSRHLLGAYGASPASNRRWPMEAGDRALRPRTNAIQVSVPDVRALKA